MSRQDVQSTFVSLRQVLQKHEEQLIDFEENICLLCKRRFKNSDQIGRHRSLSKLHSTRLKGLRQRLFTSEQLDIIERREREALYRDRAKERRLKYGQTDRVIPVEPSFLPSSDVKARKSQTAAPKPLGIDNKGAALMTKMGWQEGSGLGKNDEGITDAIKLDAHVGTSGLGSKTYKIDPSLSYKDAVKQKMYQRYHDLSSEDEGT